MERERMESFWELKVGAKVLNWEEWWKEGERGRSRGRGRMRWKKKGIVRRRRRQGRKRKSSGTAEMESGDGARGWTKESERSIDRCVGR